jgi:chemotaxis-related protein WspB
MLLLIFEAGGQTYGLDAATLIEVAPYPLCVPLPHAPAFVAGIANWRGKTIPVLDLPALLAGTRARALLGTRLLVVEYRRPPGRSNPLGLLAERAVETVVVEEKRSAPQTVAIPDAAYLDGTVTPGGKLVQCVSLDELLPESVRALLYPEPIARDGEPPSASQEAA